MTNAFAKHQESDRPAAAMMRVRLKADGRIVEILPDGTERHWAGALRAEEIADT